MRIALLMSHADRSMGGAVRDLLFLRNLARAGATVAAFRMHKGREVEREATNGGAIVTTFCPSDDPTPIPHKQVSAALVAELRGFAPDLILMKGLGYDVNRHVRAALDGGTRHAFIVGGGIRDPILGEAAFVLGEYPEQLARHFPAFTESGRGFVLPKYVDLAATALPEAPEAPLHDIVNIGNTSPSKNQAELLPFAGEWRVALVGGKATPEMRAATPKGAKPHYTGRLPHPEVLGTLRRSRLMVHTSLNDGLPRSVVEGMACSLPVVAFRDTIYGGIAEGEHGFLVSREALRPAVELLLREEPLRLHMARRARRHAETHHGPPALRRAAVILMEHLRAA